MRQASQLSDPPDAPLRPPTPIPRPARFAPMTAEVPGRAAQRARTREALLAAARALVARGELATVAAAAAEAGISKATAYRYFSDPAEMAAEAGLAVAVKGYEEVVRGAPDLRARLVAINLYFFDLACDHEDAFRQFLARNLEASLARPAAGRRRGARRMAMYARALEEDGAVPQAAREPLMRALAVATGAEAMIALLDVAGAPREAARDVAAELAEAILDRHLGPRA